MNRLLKDKLSFSSKVSENARKPVQSHGLWARTEIIGSYDEIERDKNGIAHFVKKIPTGVSALGETLFRKEKGDILFTRSNMVTIGGCQFAMEMLYGVEASQFDIPTLYDQSGIGKENSSSVVTTYDTPTGSRSVIYDPGNYVQLFGVGTTGTAANDVTVYSVDYRENSIEGDRVVIGRDNEQLSIAGQMIPFKHTSEALIDAEQKQYFGKKTDGDVTSYYLKRFEKDPEIRHIWKTGDDIDNETAISSADVWANVNGTNAVESFVQCELRITKHDVKEWFISLGQEDLTRINTIALYTGQYVKNEDGTIGDYRDVRLFSKLYIPVEYLSLSKDLNLIYRVYTA